VPLVEVNGVRLLAEETGKGEPLVLVHGSWDDRQAWMFVEDDLAKSFRVISYDRRGHTGSEDSPQPGSRRDDEDDLAALIEAHGLAPTHLVANSFGASIALSLTARQPELVCSVCAHEPPLMGLVADDPVVAQVGERVGTVVSLIDRADAEAGARLFVEEVALGPGAWELMPRRNAMP
jgi:pimeloyl-ACP methyl ester carboxylesterase